MHLYFLRVKVEKLLNSTDNYHGTTKIAGNETLIVVLSFKTMSEVVGEWLSS